MSKQDLSSAGPMLIHGFDAYYRGKVYPLCDTAEDIVPSVKKLVWAEDIFRTDQDPVYIFVDYHLMHVVTWVGSNRITDKSGRTLDYRYWNLLSPNNELQHSGCFKREASVDNSCFKS